jgi:hypothetical protein
VAPVAEGGPSPDIDIRWNRVTLVLSTHSLKVFRPGLQPDRSSMRERHTEWQPSTSAPSPHLMVEGADELVEFLPMPRCRVLTRRDHGTMLHAEVCIGDSMLIVEATDETARSPPRSPHVDRDDAFAASLRPRRIATSPPRTATAPSATQ